MKHLTYSIILIILISSCVKNTKKVNSIVDKADTVRPIVDYSYFNKECTKKFDGYFYNLGYVISNYYEIIEQTGINESDTIFILSPIILTPTASDCRDESKEIVNNRLLVACMSGRNKIYHNVISNKIGQASSGCESIESTKNGFILTKSSGQSCDFSYKIFISIEKNDLVIDSIGLSSSCPNDRKKQKIINYVKKDFSLSKYNRNVIDSLRICE